MRRGIALPVAVAAGFFFLYAPIASLIVFSFNESRLVTVWAGFSLRWYGELLRDEELLEAAWLSVRVAFWAASIALVVGTAAAYVLTRYGRFRLRALLTGMVTAPLVMPEVILGLSLLLLFVSLDTLVGWPAGRGVTTIVIAHATFSSAFVAVIVQSRLATLDTDVEEAAQDLGGRPLVVFFTVTLPMIAPALVSGWLLAFTLSFDDLVIASFVSGPGASTLPMVIFSRVRLGVSPDVNALATIMILVVALAIAAVAVLQVRRRRLV